MTVNGKNQDCPKGFRVADLLAQRQLDPNRVAVERNGSIVPNDRFEDTLLEPDDRLELVGFVGGG